MMVIQVLSLSPPATSACMPGRHTAWSISISFPAKISTFPAQSPSHAACSKRTISRCTRSNVQLVPLVSPPAEQCNISCSPNSHRISLVPWSNVDETSSRTCLFAEYHPLCHLLLGGQGGPYPYRPYRFLFLRDDHTRAGCSLHHYFLMERYKRCGH